MPKNITVSWSGGKDSAAALYSLARRRAYRGYSVSGLVTTLTATYDRVCCHGVRRALIERQADLLGLPVHFAYIPQRATMAQYEQVTETTFERLKDGGSGTVAFGDIFLDDVKRRRLSSLDRVGMAGIFPCGGSGPIT